VRIDHGTQITRAIKEGLIDTARSVQIGIRTVAPETYGIAILDAPHVHGRAPAEVAAEALAIVGRGPAYLTFDIDCLDPAFAPGTGTPVVGGLSSHQALTILRALGPIDFVGMDLVEVCPPYDHGGITALAGATVVHDFIAQILVPKGRGAARKAAR
jgi:agmatinase